MKAEVISRLRKRHYTFLAAFILLAIIIYRIGLSPTIGLLKRRHQLLNEIENSRNIFQVSDSINMINRNFETTLHLDHHTDQSRLLDILTSRCRQYGIELMQFPEKNVSWQENIGVETQEIVVKGNFTQLFTFIYDFETRSNAGLVTSTQYFTKYDNGKKKSELFLRFFIQNYLTNKS